VDPYAVVPAVVIVLCTALIGALLVARGKRH
jgi:hypothetical protein